MVVAHSAKGAELDAKTLQDWLDAKAKELEVPGVAIGVYHQGKEFYAYTGVTSVDNPLPVDEKTLFLYGSTQKTYTATAIMILVDQAKISLDDPVKKHVPELKLKDKHCEDNVTVLQLLNHTSGWQGDAREEGAGDGDDAIANFVTSMADIEQVTPLGSAFSYNNAALNLAGRVIEKVTGQVYEKAMRELLLDPLGLNDTLFFPAEVMVRRFAMGHHKNKEEQVVVHKNYALSRCSSPAGGFAVSATAPDQIAWAKFHLGDGAGVLSKDLLDKMKVPTFEIAGSALGDAVGISWFLRDVAATGDAQGAAPSGSGSVQLCSHGGDVIGQHSEFVMCPERDFAVIVLTNCDGSGSQLKDEAVKFALESFIGVVDKDPEPVKLPDEALAPYAGTYETVAVFAKIEPQDGLLILTVDVKPEMRAELEAQEGEVPEQPPIPLGMLAADSDFYVVADGVAKGMRGYFVRDADGNVDSVHVGGRLATRVKEPVPA
jgi:CubicO group peptidase (beta-lactamase class C family)